MNKKEFIEAYMANPLRNAKWSNYRCEYGTLFYKGYCLATSVGNDFIVVDRYTLTQVKHEHNTLRAIDTTLTLLHAKAIPRTLIDCSN